MSTSFQTRPLMTGREMILRIKPLTIDLPSKWWPINSKITTFARKYSKFTMVIMYALIGRKMLNSVRWLSCSIASNSTSPRKCKLTVLIPEKSASRSVVHPLGLVRKGNPLPPHLWSVSETFPLGHTLNSPKRFYLLSSSDTNYPWRHRLIKIRYSNW